MKRYLINEMFYSLQGEGVRAGTANVFVRFAKCNLACNREVDGFDCDTDFESGVWSALGELEAGMRRLADPGCDWCVLTGGEPLLQADAALGAYLRDRGWRIALETNGTRPLRFPADWVCVSPKPSGGPLALLEADEVKFVLAAGQEPPELALKADHWLVSPAYDGDRPRPGALEWCIRWCLENPPWRLSVQQHKGWGIR